MALEVIGIVVALFVLAWAVTTIIDRIRYKTWNRKDPSDWNW